MYQPSGRCIVSFQLQRGSLPLWINSIGSTAFGVNMLKPAESARVRSSTLTHAVKAAAGVLPTAFSLESSSSFRWRT